MYLKIEGKKRDREKRSRRRRRRTKKRLTLVTVVHRNTEREREREKREQTGLIRTTVRPRSGRLIWRRNRYRKLAHTRHNMFRSLLLYTHSDSLSLIPFIFFYLSVCLYCSVASFLSYSFFFFFPLSFSAFFLLLLISCYCETIFQKHSKRNAHNTLSLETTTIGNKQHFISQKFFDGFFSYF